MKKIIILMILVISSTTMFAQSTKKGFSDFNIKGFKPFPEIYNTPDRTNLIDKIIPDSKYKYWDCWYYEKDSRKLMVYNGNFMLYGSKTKNVNPRQGFFWECLPSVCFTYIVAIKDQGKIDLIDTETKLKQFIGHIDNIEEVILLAKCNGFWFDSDTLIGGSYKERKNDYLLYLVEYSYEPVTYKSVKAILSKDGNLRVLSKKTYKQTDDYFSF